MKQFSSVDEALDFAILREEESYDLYTDMAAKIERKDMQELFRSFAKEELGHKAKLLGIKRGKYLEPSKKQVMDLKIGDYLVDVDPSEELDYQKALVLAMKKEKAAFKLYTDLAATAPNPELKDTFLALAQEEARHKLRFEIEYDNVMMREN